MTPPNLPKAASKPGLAASSSSDDPVPAEVHAVIDLFTTQLANVSFPDIDAAALRRQADELRTQCDTVAHAQAALDAALESFVSRLATLTETAARAVAYARIYSVAHPDQHALATAIAALSKPVPNAICGTPASSKRRGRSARRDAEPSDATASPPLHED